MKQQVIYQRIHPSDDEREKETNEELKLFNIRKPTSKSVNALLNTNRIE